jgi:hypothetical protein
MTDFFDGDSFDQMDSWDDDDGSGDTNIADMPQAEPHTGDDIGAGLDFPTDATDIE